MENMTDVLQPVLRAVQFNKFSFEARLLRAFEPDRNRSIVRTNIISIPNSGSHWTALRPYARIHHHDVDRAFWKIRDRTRQNIAGLTDVLRLDHVTQIRNLRGWADPPDHPFHDPHVA